MKYILFEYGFSWGTEPRCSFMITPHYQREDAHEVDFRIDIMDSNGRPHIFYVESKNCRDHYTLTPDRFYRYILPRFTTNDPPDDEGHHEGHWMVTLNARHRRELGQLCLEHNIEIIPLDVILTTPPTVDELTIAMNAFSVHFIELIQGHLNCLDCRRPDPGNVREFLLLKVPELDICSRLGIELSTLQKVKSEMRAEGISLGPDGRTKAGKAIHKKMKDL